MEIGIFASTFTHPTLADTLDAVVAHGLRHIQFNFTCAGLPSMPDQIEPDLVETIRKELDARQLVLTDVSGTFNIIHPDVQVRSDGMRQLRTLAAACEGLGASIITLSTGTRNVENMWHHHPDNQSSEAWRDCVESMREIAAIGEEFGVTMAFEPEVNNVIDSAERARRLLDEIGSPYLKVVIDGANVFHTGELARMAEVLDTTFELLGKDIVLAHAKDLNHDGDAGHEPAGHGLLDYDRYVRLLKQAGYTGPLVLHGLNESQVDGCVAFLREKLAAVES